MHFDLDFCTYCISYPMKTEAPNLTGFGAFDDNLTGLWLIQLLLGYETNYSAMICSQQEQKRQHCVDSLQL
jgi:hypothetical protein